jgi:hypothetical protein
MLKLELKFEWILINGQNNLISSFTYFLLNFLNKALFFRYPLFLIENSNFLLNLKKIVSWIKLKNCLAFENCHGWYYYDRTIN